MPTIPEKEEIIEIKEAIITLRNDGVIQITYKKGVVIDIDLQNRIAAIFNELCKDGKRPFLFNAFDGVSVTPEARANAIKMEKTFPAIATAVLADTLAYKLIANFYLKVNRPQSPYRVFTEMEKAIEWLQSFVK